MKKFILPIVMLLLVSFTVSDVNLTDSERQMAVTEMAKTKDYLMKTVKGLSDARLNFKSSPESWSIAECVEHIAISESMIFGMLDNALKTPASPDRRSEVKIPDSQLLKIITDRSNKVKTREPFEPTGKFGSYKATLKEFKKKRSEHIKYLKKTDDDLRNHYAELPFGTIDGLQVLLFMSGHTHRHVDQIKEIMANENFPKQ
ncbi:DinB family protein [Leptobacterium flavescens]|uniref:DinB family protein n=1 Tax=Leptobacterium flavescens TaxID=472055 RepID=A0A6P0UGA1_9FLAO|nr:DinB family protein [Leptobacterium flavescens]NER12047.1 DinB family protein [Leptobacterium flavescens]